MRTIITVIERDGLTTRTLNINVEILDTNINLKKAISDACKEYCLTDEGRKTYEGNCNCFNWADFDTYVPNAICSKYGFVKIHDNYDYLDVIWDEQLVDEADIFPEL